MFPLHESSKDNGKKIPAAIHQSDKTSRAQTLSRDENPELWKLISKFYKVLNGKIKIIGVGGVDSGKGAYEKFLAGANYVQLYTGMVYRGPNIVNMIKKELKELLLKDGVKNFSEIVGKKE